jgi:lipopolysaccharide export system protein LptA
MQSTARTSRASAKALLAVLGVALAASLPAAARQSDRNEQVHVDAKTFDGRQQPQGIVIYTGNVIITQGTLKIEGAKATVYLNDDNSIKRAVIDGSPARMQQQDDQGEWMHGRGNNIDYKVEEDYAVLTGNAHVDQPTKGSADGDKLTYNTKDSTMTGESLGGAPVHMTFQPKNKPGAAPAGAPAKPATPASADDKNKKP